MVTIDPIREGKSCPLCGGVVREHFAGSERPILWCAECMVGTAVPNGPVMTMTIFGSAILQREAIKDREMYLKETSTAGRIILCYLCKRPMELPDIDQINKEVFGGIASKSALQTELDNLYREGLIEDPPMEGEYTFTDRGWEFFSLLDENDIMSFRGF